MATNDRIFYACQAVAIAKNGHYVNPTTIKAGTAAVMRGVQSVGITSNFNLEQVFEFGQIQIYENIETVADIEVTCEKVIDGNRLLYLQAVGAAGETGLSGASKSKCDVYLAIYDDGVDQVADTAEAHVVMCSGMTVSSVSYTYPVDGNATESVTLVGNDKFWDGFLGGAGGPARPDLMYAPTGAAAYEQERGPDGTDLPVSGVVRRINFDVTNSNMPSDVETQGPATSRHYQNVSVSADFGREELTELGRFGPYVRYASFPFEVSCEIEVMATSGDLINVSGAGTNLSAHQITIKDTAGTVLNLGAQNKLTSVSYTGGDTGGGNASITYSYSTFNDLSVKGGASGIVYWPA
tara:strand:+ start:4131 stop:5186 length:1056 start_codon:yes stop_codon:yes gene_type:complete